MTGTPATIANLLAQFPTTIGAGRFGAQNIQNIIATLQASTSGFIPQTYGTITDGGSFGDGLSHPASANGFSTLAALQTQFQAATFTATGSGTNITFSNVTGLLYPTLTLGIVAGIGAGITIVRQTSGTTGGAGVYVTSGSTTISGGAGIASWASATSNDMAGLMIQAAIHDGSMATYATVPLFAGRYYNLPTGITFPSFTSVRLMGGRATALLCSPCGTHPGVSVIACETNDCPIESVELWGTDTKQFGSVPGNGTPNTGIFNAGSVAMNFTLCNEMRVKNILFQNFDMCHTWDVVQGGNYMVCFRDCTYVLNNKAAVVDSPTATNSFERMSWDNCGFGSNNYAAWINYASGGSSFPPYTWGGTPIAADAYFFNCSFDYSCVQQIVYNGGASTPDHLSSVYCIGCHFETNLATSGTVPRVYNNGCMFFLCCEILENGPNPLGFLQPVSAASAQSFIACKGPGVATGDSNAIPFLIGDATANVQGYGNFSRGGGTLALLTKSSIGAINSYRRFDTATVVISGNSTMFYAYPTNVPLLVSATCTITIPNDSDTFFDVGTVFQFVNLATFTGTFSGAGGVQVHASAKGSSGLTFGGATVANVGVVKIAGNEWNTFGQMT